MQGSCEFMLIKAWEKLGSEVPEVKVKEPEVFELKGAYVANIDIKNGVARLTDFNSTQHFFNFAKGRVTKRISPWNCIFCQKLKILKQLINTSFGYQLALIECDCPVRSAQSDDLPIDSSFIAIIQNSKMIGILDRNCSTANADGCSIDNGDFAYTNKEVIVYREAICKRIVEVKWDNIKQGVFNQFTYRSVPAELEKEPVADLVLRSNGKIVALCENGKIAEDISKERVIQPLQEEATSWSLIKYLFPGKYLVTCLFRLDFKPTIGFHILNAISGKSRATNLTVDYNQHYVTGLQSLTEIRRSHGGVLYAAASFCSRFHLVFAGRQRVSIIKANLKPSGDNDDWINKIYAAKGKGNKSELFVAATLTDKIHKYTLAIN